MTAQSSFAQDRSVTIVILGDVDVVSTRPLDIQASLKRLQDVQSDIARLQYAYADSEPAFWALHLAWEAIRHAWYVVFGDLDTATQKLESVKDAIKDCEQFVCREG